MIHPKILMRLIHIKWVMLSHGLDEIVLDTSFFSSLRYLTYVSPYRWLKKDKQPRAVRIRQALEDLGPIYVKFGQALSTRKDLLSEDIADELVKLQDKVPPFSSDVAIEIIEESLGMSIDRAFASFDEKPLASASVAQVHTAVLHTGENVVVKVLRPEMQQRIQADVNLMYEVAKIA
ncbi:MAG: ubiquinone biosynthesis regulatory protein kinase UbiB, partial [Methylococcales bacterium]|nr:ubiquinone biosynthesis regulatory protein kinase UbiB [Methylococcales bacterium]